MPNEVLPNTSIGEADRRDFEVGEPSMAMSAIKTEGLIDELRCRQRNTSLQTHQRPEPGRKISQK